MEVGLDVTRKHAEPVDVGADVSDRLHDAFVDYFVRRGYHLPTHFVQATARVLVDPAIPRLLATSPTRLQIDGAVAKLEFLLDEMMLALGPYLGTNGPFKDDPLDDAASRSLIAKLDAKLAPLWPFLVTGTTIRVS